MNSAQLPDPARFTSIADFLGVAINVMVGVGFAFSILSIGYAGILYITTSGDPKNATKAWNAFLWGTIAACFSIGAFALKAAVLNAIGIQEPNITNVLPNI